LSKVEWRLKTAPNPARVFADRLLMPFPDWLVALEGLPNAPPTNLHFAATNIEYPAYN